MKPLRIAIAQINSTVGDIPGNSRKILEYTKRAARAGADVVVFPELAILGYPPEDLLLKPSFIEENIKGIREIAKSIRGITAIVGFADKADGELYNAAAVIADGKIKKIYRKMQLPNYGVFDEKRYFKEGADPSVFKIRGITCGINICEDIWSVQAKPPIRLQAGKGADVIFVMNASPYHSGKSVERERIVRMRARNSGVYIAYANLVGGQDELVFDGQSFIADPQGKIIARAKAFKEDLLVADMCNEGRGTALGFAERRACRAPTTKPGKILSLHDEVYMALILGLRDYVRKNGFKKVLIGLSGGIDSALTAVIAKEALGAENTIGVFMPSMFTSKISGRDARELAKNLGIRMETIPIGELYKAYMKSLANTFKGWKKDIAEENIQARVRGNILMALSNKFGYLVLTTGNKSEISCGYCTLYGDMAGGFSVIKDVPKTLVYALADRVVNRDSQIIPKSIISRPPTAELRRDQKDTDTLPPYEVLDPIIKAYVEKDLGVNDIVKKGFGKQLVLRVVKMIDRNEYKRRQAAPGIKITPKALGKDRRIPITNRFAER